MCHLALWCCHYSLETAGHGRQNKTSISSRLSRCSGQRRAVSRGRVVGTPWENLQNEAETRTDLRWLVFVAPKQGWRSSVTILLLLYPWATKGENGLPCQPTDFLSMSQSQSHSFLAHPTGGSRTQPTWLHHPPANEKLVFRHAEEKQRLDGVGACVSPPGRPPCALLLPHTVTPQSVYSMILHTSTE